MYCNDYENIEISALGFGTRRLPLSSEGSEVIDLQAVTDMVNYAVAHEVSYFDTAWEYQQGYSEEALGKVLANHRREYFYLANRFPGFNRENYSRVEDYFKTQLAKCRTAYFDFYAADDVCDDTLDMYLDEQNSVMKFFLMAKESKRIKNLGFCSTGSFDSMKRFLDCYGEDIDYCQLELNWRNGASEEMQKKLQLLADIEMPIVAAMPFGGEDPMEGISPEQMAKLQSVHSDWDINEWAFRYVQSIENVLVTLSGTSSLDHLKDNVARFEDYSCLNKEEKALLESIAAELQA